MNNRVDFFHSDVLDIVRLFQETAVTLGKVHHTLGAQVIVDWRTASLHRPCPSRGARRARQVGRGQVGLGHTEYGRTQENLVAQLRLACDPKVVAGSRNRRIPHSARKQIKGNRGFLNLSHLKRFGSIHTVRARHSRDLIELYRMMIHNCRAGKVELVGNNKVRDGRKLEVVLNPVSRV